jgi:hypothetical protein
MLEDHDGEEDEDDEDILTQNAILQHVSAELNLFTKPRRFGGCTRHC